MLSGVADDALPKGPIAIAGIHDHLVAQQHDIKIAVAVHVSNRNRRAGTPETTLLDCERSVSVS